jgi:hypothetical protein
MQDLFADRLVNVMVHQGIARLDFARLQSLDPEKQQARFESSVRLAMPVDAFLHLAEQIEKVRAALVEQTRAQADKVNDTN